MRVYVLDKNTTLVINGEVFVLAREKKISNNSVCAQCALAYKCIDGEDNHHLSTLCIPNEDDQRWFFIDCQDLSKRDAENILYQIEKCLDIEY